MANLVFRSLGTVTYCSKFEAADGRIGDTAVTGGSGTYQFTWSDSSKITTAGRTLLTAGIYTLTVIDRGGTAPPKSYEFVMRQPRPIEFTVSTIQTKPRLSRWSKGRNFFFIDEAPPPSIPGGGGGGGAVFVPGESISLADNAAIFFGEGTWRLRYEPINTELVFEHFQEGAWSTRFVVD